MESCLSKKQTMKIKVRSPSVRNLDLIGGAFDIQSDSKDVESSNFQGSTGQQNEEIADDIRQKLCQSPLNQVFSEDGGSHKEGDESQTGDLQIFTFDGKKSKRHSKGNGLKVIVQDWKPVVPIVCKQTQQFLVSTDQS